VAQPLLKISSSFLLLALTRRSVGPLFLGAQSPALEGMRGRRSFSPREMPMRLLDCAGAPIVVRLRIMPRSALGLIETSGIDGALRATHAASNSGQVVIVSAEQSTGGRMTVKIEGDWVAVQSAIEAGARAAFVAGELLSMHVIPRPDDGVTPILPYSRFVDRYRPEEQTEPKKKSVTKPSARVKSVARVPRRVEASTPAAAARTLSLLSFSIIDRKRGTNSFSSYSHNVRTANDLIWGSSSWVAKRLIDKNESNVSSPQSCSISSISASRRQCGRLGQIVLNFSNSDSSISERRYKMRGSKGLLSSSSAASK